MNTDDPKPETHTDRPEKLVITLRKLDKLETTMYRYGMH